MLKTLINAVIGNSNQRLLKKYSSIVNKINELETDIQKLKDKVWFPIHQNIRIKLHCSKYYVYL